MAPISPAVSGCVRTARESMRLNSSAVEMEKAGLQMTIWHSGSGGSGVSRSPLPSARAMPPETQ